MSRNSEMRRNFVRKLFDKAVDVAITSVRRQMDPNLLAREDLVTELRRAVERTPSMEQSLSQRLQAASNPCFVIEEVKVIRKGTTLQLTWSEHVDTPTVSSTVDTPTLICSVDTPTVDSRVDTQRSSGKGVTDTIQQDEKRVQTEKDDIQADGNKTRRIKTTLLAEFLRVHSSSTDTIGVLLYGRRGLKVQHIVPQGSYAIRIWFSDEHNAGIFSFEYLAELGGPSKFGLMRQYLRKLLMTKKSRNPPATVKKKIRQI